MLFSTGPLIIAGACVVLLLVLFALRGTAAMKGEIPKPLVGVVIVVAVLVAVAIMYRATSPARVAGGESGGEGMMMEGGGMGSGGGMRRSSPQRDLGQLVRKMAMLKSQQEDAFTPEQVGKLLPVLQTLAKAEGMTGEEAEAKKAELAAILTEEQTAALEALELPRRRRGGPGGLRPGGDPGVPGATVPTAAATGAEAGGSAPPAGGPGGGRGDWRAAMRARMLETPYVKKLYDEQVAADPGFATDEEKQSEFFRGLRDSLSPFLRGPSQEALQGLIKALSPQA
jgi:hypothetical protein